MKSPSPRAPSRRARRSAVPAASVVDPRTPPERVLAFARALADDGETTRALRVLAELTWRHPCAREAWALRGVLALALGDVALAEACSLRCAEAVFLAGGGARSGTARPAVWA